MVVHAVWIDFEMFCRFFGEILFLKLWFPCPQELTKSSAKYFFVLRMLTQVLELPEAKIAKVVLKCYMKDVAKHTPSLETPIPKVPNTFYKIFRSKL